MNFRSTCDLMTMIFKNMPYIPRGIDLVVGIPRSGMLVASYISILLNKPLVDFDGYLKGEIFDVGLTRKPFVKLSNREVKRVLIVDDSIRTGNQMQTCKEKLQATDIKDKIYWLAAIATDESKKKINYYFDICEQPRIFEWNMMTSAKLKDICMDIDDVITLSASRTKGGEERDYSNLLPLYLPGRPVAHLVTCRIEKDRGVTEEWLKRYNVKYGKLHMMQYETEAERRKDRKHANYKADVYIKTKCKLFIESSEAQAVNIAKLSKKPVLCIDTMKVYK